MHFKTVKYQMYGALQKVVSQFDVAKVLGQFDVAKLKGK